MRKYEDSRADKAEDRRGAKKTGKSLAAYERSARDQKEDKAGQKRMARGGR
jgi:hypothetical protein